MTLKHIYDALMKAEKRNDQCLLTAEQWAYLEWSVQDEAKRIQVQCTNEYGLLDKNLFAKRTGDVA